jgi:hypothetical protein
MANKIETEWRQWNATRDSLRGYFILSDKTKIQWRIFKAYNKWEWQQWGAPGRELGLTVDRIEDIVAEVVQQEVTSK